VPGRTGDDILIAEDVCSRGHLGNPITGVLISTESDCKSEARIFTQSYVGRLYDDKTRPEDTYYTTAGYCTKTDYGERGVYYHTSYSKGVPLLMRDELDMEGYMHVMSFNVCYFLNRNCECYNSGDLFSVRSVYAPKVSSYGDEYYFNAPFFMMDKLHMSAYNTCMITYKTFLYYSRFLRYHRSSQKGIIDDILDYCDILRHTKWKTTMYSKYKNCKQRYIDKVLLRRLEETFGKDYFLNESELFDLIFFVKCVFDTGGNVSHHVLRIFSAIIGIPAIISVFENLDIVNLIVPIGKEITFLDSLHVEQPPDNIVVEERYLRPTSDSDSSSSDEEWDEYLNSDLILKVDSSLATYRHASYDSVRDEYYYYY